MKRRFLHLIVLALTALPQLTTAAVILQYHHVDSNTPPITSTSPARFEEHLAHIETTQLKVVPLQEIVAATRKNLNDRVAITFDDAYVNILNNAVPLLEERGWPFTVFVSTKYVGQHGYLTWEQLRQIETAGGTVANHTHTHLHMLRRERDENRTEWLARMKHEITHSQALMEKHGLSPKRHFAFPYGEYNQELMQLLDTLSFVGFGQQSGAVGSNSDPQLMPRFPLSGVYADMANFKLKLQSLALPAEVEFHPPLVTTNPPSLELTFEGDSSLRLSELRCYGPGGQTDITFSSDLVATATNRQPVPIGRSRYNCTMPHATENRFYWFSQLWIRKEDDGSWYPEP